ncbi:MAG: hypothetical protein HOK41_03155 [Nitrospina sp.]|jgi:energy-coupling factor transporter transmembrane protein EcfT|nr:hypothetical protein [Nitrospina sp.]MBT6718794.1 hypothetical protein [Nitrospina sp.]
MNETIFSPNSGGFVPGSGWIYGVRSDYKICGTFLLLALSGMADGIILAVLTLMVFGLAKMASISFREIYLMMRKLAWFFMAIFIFPVFFTPGYFLDLPLWIPINISWEGLTLASESCVRLINVLLISAILMRTTSNLLEGVDNLICDQGIVGKKIKELIRIAVMSIELLPLIFQKAERQLAELKSVEKMTLTQTVQKAIQQVVPFIISVFSTCAKLTQPNEFPQKLEGDSIAEKGIDL